MSKRKASIKRTRELMQNKRNVFIFVGVFALIGVATLLISKVATPAYSVEAEDGTRTGSASIIPASGTDSTLSGGRAIAFGSAVTPPPSTGQPPTAVTGGATWNTLWADEFNGSSIDTSKWNVLNNSNYGTGNNEEECYMTGNTVVSGGSLRLIGKQDSNNGCSGYKYTSGFITTSKLGGSQKFKFKQGYTEIRARLPKGGGWWPAFWLVGADTAPGWPAYGEIDVMEAYGTYPCCIEETFHWDNGGHKQEGGASRDVGSTDNTDWHTYGVNWTASKLDFYIDGVKKQTFTPSDSGATAALGYEHTIDINLAIGGDGPRKYHGWNGTWASGDLPGTYEVDYVRVWQP